MTTPREHWADVATPPGVARTVGWCADQLTGAVTVERPGDAAFTALGSGDYLQRILDGESPDYWIRVWAARGLPYVWDDMAATAVVAGLLDEHWRVREICAKVCRRRGLGEAGDDLGNLVADEVPRVRLAAVRALAGLGVAEHARLIRQAVNDVDVKVSSAAEAVLDAISERLDRDLPRHRLATRRPDRGHRGRRKLPAYARPAMRWPTSAPPPRMKHPVDCATPSGPIASSRPA